MSPTCKGFFDNGVTREDPRAVQKTSYPDIDRLLDSLLSRMRHILPEKLVGLYLYGSLMTGDFDPETSDIDLLAATLSDISEPEFEALHAMHQAFARDNPEWEDRVEVAYLSMTALRMFRSERSPIAPSGMFIRLPGTVGESRRG